MAGAGVSGQFGDAKIGAVQIAEVCKWNFNPKAMNPSYSSNKTGGYKTRVAGIKDGNGTIEGKYDPANPIMAVMDVGTIVTLKLYLTLTVFYSVPAIVDALKLSVDIDTGEFVAFTADFSTVGAWVNPVAGMMATPPPGGEGFSPGPTAEEGAVFSPVEQGPRMAEQLEHVQETVREEFGRVQKELLATVADVATQAATLAIQQFMESRDRQPPVSSAA